MTEAAQPARGRIPRYTVIVSLVIIPFLVVASVLLYLLPSRTDELFAWTIEPELTAMFLGAAYLGGIWFFVQVVRTRDWSAVRHGFPAVVAFATLLAVATLVHLDRFHAGHISFITWLTLYLTTPFLVLAAIHLNRRLDDGSDGGGYLIPRAARVAIAGVGATALAAGLVLFAFPQLLVNNWAWALTPLTARVVGAILTLPGMVDIWMLRDARWSAFRLVFQAQLFSLAFLVGALLLARDDLDWSRPATPLVVGGLALSVVAYCALYLYCERGRRAARSGAGRVRPAVTR